jgi:hypothetical protein
VNRDKQANKCRAERGPQRPRHHCSPM